MKISVLGPAGSYSEIAAHAFLSIVLDAQMPELLYCSSIENTVLSLFEDPCSDNGAVCAVIPIENSIEGAVGVSMDLLLEKDVSIIAELILPVNHCLLVPRSAAQKPDFSPDKIEVVYSHPQGLYQCRTYIRNHLKNASLIEVDSTSKAATRVAEMSAGAGLGAGAGAESVACSGADLTAGSAAGSTVGSAVSSAGADKIRAAIASAAAGEKYGLKAIDCHIQDTPNNSTRFLFLARSEMLPHLKAYADDFNLHILPENLSQTGSGAVFYKTSVIVSPVSDKPGALFKILEAFSDHEINLTRIESRPSKKSLGEYNFYIDFEGSPSDKNVADALNLVKKRSARLKNLGTYGRILSGRQ
ncbi:Bifunctional chorismate mutase/prephenate dehydratase [Methanimicrococcus stummii]|uniref:prephenate dehydratase n=1 Tax=Methanimicrococcus stummii TaxID=3028294 RepID=A0AA97A8D2_9EURY|nr:prephenate dehydratase domain-containing protein [Methanimicrococcus sp. Es2]WNY28928.1 Bifunctional chorismate mutase/prephenate dehydratase [Methanimicrococcus sp. Es2]